MNLVSHLVQRALKLPPPVTRGLVVEPDLRVPMPDGVELLANRWAPRVGGENLPTALIRTPYGRRGILAAVMARSLAERGYQVLIQSTRGGFGSGGAFDPLRQERADGLATLEWVVKQPWFGDSIVLVGLSYLGYVQWAVADALPPQVKAMIPQVAESALTLEFLREDGMSLETPFGWGTLIACQERPWARRLGSARKVRRALDTLPLGGADVAAIGGRDDYIQDILAHDAEDERWAGIDHRHRVAGVSVPVSSVGGWYDIFLPGQLRDFRILQEAGRPARLTIGPWTHLAVDGTSLREAVEFGLAHARGEEPPERAPVRLYVMGEEAWRDFDAWPPSGYEPQRFTSTPTVCCPRSRRRSRSLTGTATTPRIRRPRSAVCGWSGTAAAPRTPRWSRGRTCSPTPPPCSIGTSRSSVRSAPRCGSVPACRSPMCSSGSAMSTSAGARTTSATASPA